MANEPLEPINAPRTEAQREQAVAICVDDFRAFYKVRGHTTNPLDRCELIVDGKAIL